MSPEIRCWTVIIFEISIGFSNIKICSFNIDKVGAVTITHQFLFSQNTKNLIYFFKVTSLEERLILLSILNSLLFFLHFTIFQINGLKLRREKRFWGFSFKFSFFLRFFFSKNFFFSSLFED